MGKRTISVIAVALLCATAFSSVIGGGIGEAKVARTEHFDIIYKESSIETASLLYDNCEDIYDSLVDLIGMDPELHIPVVVTSTYKTLNAYFTNYTANHIVMFDTVGEQGDLSNFDQTILYIFRHELTHAFQYNYRGPVFDFLSKVFGDIVSLPPLFYLYPSMAEGGAVFSESFDGYGRINSSYSMQIVKQAKLEGCFPTWLEIAGSRDTYPSGLLYYNFSAAFLDYLSITYGRDAVASLFSDFRNMRWWPTPGQVIKAHIDIPVSQAWEDFYEWVQVPETVKTPSEINSRNHRGRYSTLQYGPDGSVYVYESSTYSVLKFTEDLSSCSSILGLCTSEASISISRDGSMMLIPYVMEDIAQVRLYDISSSKAKLIHTFSSEDRDYRGGSLVVLDGVEYALLYGNEWQRTYLQLFSLDDYAAVEGKGVSLGFDVRASEFARLSGDRVAFILNNAAHDHIAILSLSDMDISLLENPDDISMISLSAGRNGSSEVLSFCWYPSDAKEPNLGRYGEILIEDGFTMRLSDVDISGSMQGSVLCNDEVLFFSRFYEVVKLGRIDVSELGLCDSLNIGIKEMITTQIPDTSALSAASVKYRDIRYFKDGLLLPAATIDLGNDVDGGLGLSWMTTDPTETHSHLLSAGYGYGNVLGSYKFSSSNFFLPYTVSVNGAYGTGLYNSEKALPEGDVRLNAGISTSLTFNLRGANERLVLDESYRYNLSYIASSDLFSGSHQNNLALSYAYVKPFGPGYYQSFQFVAKAYLDNLSPGLTLSTFIPHILWWRCDGPNTTNLPISLSINGNFKTGYADLAVAGVAKVILYGREIQHAISFLGLYFQRFELSALYRANYTPSSDILTHKAELTGVFTLSPVVGAYLTQLKMVLGGTLVWDLNKNEWSAKLALDLDV